MGGRLISWRGRNNSFGSAALAIVVLATAFSCCSFAKPEFDVADLWTESRANGCLVQLSTGRKVEAVEALLTRSDWLIITIPNATVDFDRIRSISPNELVSSVEIIGFRQSVQVSLKLNKKFASCEVVQNKGTRDIVISLIPR